LEIIEIPLLRAEPRRHQTENHLIDAAGHWVKKDQLPWNRLAAIRDRPVSIWINSDSTSVGIYDRISQADAATVRNSLVLIRPESFSVQVGRNYWTGRKSFRAVFRYNGTDYNLSVTDPVARDAFGAKEEGEYP
jgi:hypothetical protein